MEKRALIAVVLSLLVIFLYQFIFLSSPEKSRESYPELEREAVPEPAPAEIVREAVSPPRLLAPAEKSGRRIVVDSDLFRLELNPEGARIESLALKKYRETVGPESPPVDIVRLSEEGNSLPINFIPGEEKEGDQKLTYAASTDYLPVTEEKQLTLRDPGESGPVRRYEFKPGSYLWSLEYQGRAGGGAQAAMVSESRLQEMGRKRFKVEKAFTGVVALINQEVENLSLKKLREPKFFSSGVEWVGFENKYFLFAFVPPPETEVQIRLREAGDEQNAVIILRLPPGNQRVSVYSGPKDMDQLSRAGVELERAVNLGWFGSIARPLLALMKWLDRGVNNYGVAIIILTVLIKILFYPLTQMSMKSMKKMQNLQPLMTEIREKYKDDREKMNREMMGMYKREKINPMGGCLPILIQIPIFIALYQALMNAIEIRHAPFIWWINDLSAPEDLFDLSLGGLKIPVRLLPLLMGGSMFLQQKLSPTAGDPRQAQIMMFMPLIFTFMFWGFPSGLVIYWLVNNVLSIAQQMWVNRKTGAEPGAKKRYVRRKD